MAPLQVFREGPPRVKTTRPSSLSSSSSRVPIISVRFASARGLFVLSLHSISPSHHPLHPLYLSTISPLSLLSLVRVRQQPASGFLPSFLLTPSVDPAAAVLRSALPSDLKHDPRRGAAVNAITQQQQLLFLFFFSVFSSSSCAPHINIGRLFSEYRGEPLLAGNQSSALLVEERSNYPDWGSSLVVSRSKYEHVPRPRPLSPAHAIWRNHPSLPMSDLIPVPTRGSSRLE